MKIQRPQSLGFTILELMVVLAIFAVVTGIGSIAFVKITDYWNGLSARVEMDRGCQEAFDNIESDLESVIPSALLAGALSGESRTSNLDAFFGIPLADDTLSIPVLARDPGGRSVPAIVTYSVNRDNAETPLLVRAQRPIDGGENAQTEITVAQGVLQFRVEYSNGEEWRSDWTEQALPAAVQISLNLAVPGNPSREQVSRVHVIPVEVQ